MSLSRLIVLFLLLGGLASADYPSVATYPAAEAIQAVAVDADFFYAIDNTKIGKYRKSTGQKVAVWEAKPDSSFIHMNSGVVVEGKLYCAHSTWPHHPWASSIEVFDCETLKHEKSISLGLRDGALNWVDYHQGQWWAVFVHYQHDVPHSHASYVGRTSLVRMDDQWRQLESWVFPRELLEKFRPASNSGGSWGDDGSLYCTGHDLSELYELRLPASGSVLEWRGSWPADLAGQGFVWDRSTSGVLYGIDRAKREVIRLERREL